MAGLYLQASQAVGCTGQVLLHRFYAKKSLTKFNIRRVAATSVFLACKLEENPRKLRDVINVFHRIARRREGKPLEHLVRMHSSVTLPVYSDLILLIVYPYSVTSSFSYYSRTL